MMPWSGNTLMPTLKRAATTALPTGDPSPRLIPSNFSLPLSEKEICPFLAKSSQTEATQAPTAVPSAVSSYARYCIRDGV